MAEDKKKEADGKADGAKKKKGLPSIVMIAIGAIVGGAGVVFAVPPKVKEVQVPEPVYEVVDVVHPDQISQQFNPKSKAGRMGSVVFKFVYTVREDLEPKAFEEIKSHWEEASSVVLDVLTNRSMEELQNDAGVRTLEKDVIDELDRLFFGIKKEGKIASVTKLIWSKRLFQ